MIHSGLWELCWIGGALLLASNIWLFVRVLRPVHQLAVQADLISRGDFSSFERQSGGIPEIRQLQRAMSGMVQHVRRAQEQRRVYAEQLADGQENERKRIARELHDDTIQSTIAVTQGVDMAKNWVKSDPDRAIQMLQLARERAVEIVANLRNLIGGLRPPALEELGLIPALRMQVSTLRDGVVDFKISGDPRRLGEVQELALFRAVQEALHNVAKHGQAEHIHIVVNYQSNGVLLSIQDDGRGFTPPTRLGDLAFRDRYGLLGIEERMSNLGGWLKLDSKVGFGTTVEAFLPNTDYKQPVDLIRDPVCTALIEPRRAYGSLQFEDETYYFCCPVCQGAFQQDPAAYLSDNRGLVAQQTG
jgi:signal transduction histidine kinase/YHS domain-containing protein